MKNIDERWLEQLAKEMFTDSKGDLLMFVFALKYYIIQGRREALDYLEIDFQEKISKISEKTPSSKFILAKASKIQKLMDHC